MGIDACYTVYDLSAAAEISINIQCDRPYKWPMLLLQKIDRPYIYVNSYFLLMSGLCSLVKPDVWCEEDVALDAHCLQHSSKSKSRSVKVLPSLH